MQSMKHGYAGVTKLKKGSKPFRAVVTLKNGSKKTFNGYSSAKSAYATRQKWIRENPKLVKSSPKKTKKTPKRRTARKSTPKKVAKRVARRVRKPAKKPAKTPTGVCKLSSARYAAAPFRSYIKLKTGKMKTFGFFKTTQAA